MEGMTVAEIVKNYLVENGYGGLFGEGCSCELDDLIPCYFPFFPGSCEAGYRVKCTNACGQAELGSRRHIHVIAELAAKEKK